MRKTISRLFTIFRSCAVSYFIVSLCLVISKLPSKTPYLPRSNMLCYQVVAILISHIFGDISILSHLMLGLEHFDWEKGGGGSSTQVPSSAAINGIWVYYVIGHDKYDIPKCALVCCSYILLPASKLVKGWN